MDLGHPVLGEVPPGDPGLVGHNHHPRPGLVDPTDRRRRAGDQPHLVHAGQVVDLLDQRAVPVQEDRLVSRHCYPLPSPHGCGHFPVATTRRPSIRQFPAVTSRIASGYASHSAANTRAASVSGVSSSRTGTVRCTTTGPVS